MNQLTRFTYYLGHRVFNANHENYAPALRRFFVRTRIWTHTATQSNSDYSNYTLCSCAHSSSRRLAELHSWWSAGKRHGSARGNGIHQSGKFPIKQTDLRGSLAESNVCDRFCVACAVVQLLPVRLRWLVLLLRQSRPPLPFRVYLYIIYLPIVLLNATISQPPTHIHTRNGAVRCGLRWPSQPVYPIYTPQSRCLPNANTCTCIVYPLRAHYDVHVPVAPMRCAICSSVVNAAAMLMAAVLPSQKRWSRMLCSIQRHSTWIGCVSPLSNALAGMKFVLNDIRNGLSSPSGCRVVYLLYYANMNAYLRTI